MQITLICSTVDLVTYITRFQWDMAKYPIKQSLKNISEIIAKVEICRSLILIDELLYVWCWKLSPLNYVEYICILIIKYGNHPGIYYIFIIFTTFWEVPVRLFLLLLFSSKRRRSTMT